MASISLVPASVNCHPWEIWVVGASGPYRQTMAALNLGVEFCKIGIRQHNSALQHHDAFDNRERLDAHLLGLHVYCRFARTYILFCPFNASKWQYLLV